MPPAEAEAIRALNAARAASGGPGDAALREWLHGAPDARGLADLAAVAERALTRSALSDTDPVLEALHLNLWVAWGDRLVEPAGQGALFPSARREVIHADARWSDAPGPRAAIARILAMFRAETGLR
jgi:hypothetical protein